MKRIEQTLLLLLIGSIPIQLGYHFWPSFSFVSGIRVDYLSPIIYFNDLFLIVIACLFVRRSILSKKLVKMVLVPLGVLLLVCTPSVFLVQEFGSFLYQLARIVLYLFFGMSIAKNSTPIFLRKVLIVYVCSALLVVMLEIAQYVSQSSFQGLFYWLGERNFSLSSPGVARFMMGDSLIVRPYATFPHPNVLGFYLFIALLLCRYMIFKLSRVLERLIFLTIFIVLFFGLVFTFSRALILMAGVLLFLDFIKLKKIGFLMTALFLGVGFIILGERFSVDLLIEDFVQRYDHAVRFGVYLKDILFVGVGLNQYFYHQIQIEREISPYFLQPPHNVWFLILVQTGVLGLLLFLWGFWRTTKKLLTEKQSYESELVLLLFITMIFASFFDHYFITLHQGMLLVALILGLAWSRKVKEPESDLVRGEDRSHNTDLLLGL